MGRNKLKPDFFTKEWYLNQKSLEKTDKDIASDMNVDRTTLYNWKKSLGVEPLQPKKIKLVKPDYFNKKWYDEQKRLGKNDEQLAKELSVSLTILIRWKKEINVGRFRKTTLWDQYKEKALANDISYLMFMNRIRKGETPEQAIEKGRLKNVKIENERDEDLEYDLSSRIKYNPEFHENQHKPYEEDDLIYICSRFGISSCRDIAFAIGKTEGAIFSMVHRLRKNGKFDYYKSLDY